MLVMGCMTQHGLCTAPAGTPPEQLPRDRAVTTRAGEARLRWINVGHSMGGLIMSCMMPHVLQTTLHKKMCNAPAGTPSKQLP
jgi:hypothetical protein